MSAAGSAAQPLAPYVPRLLADWLADDPSTTHRSVAGSMAFVDISGFTALTERLARKGKVGSEEMSDVLNTTFTSLLDIAFAAGGDLVKWGGDAVLLLFHGDDHAARACGAARHMQAGLRHLDLRDATSSPVTLRMSAGVHSDRFHFFLVGDPRLHRELLAAGPAISRTARLESLAGAGQVAVSTETARLLDPGVVGREVERGAWLLRAASAAAGSETFRDSTLMAGDGNLDLHRTLPRPIREHLLGEAGDAEHRTIGVAFVNFTGTDELLRTHGTSALADALDAVVRSVQDATEASGTTFFESDIAAGGGKIMLVAGAPKSAGDDEDRLLHTVRLIADRVLLLPLRIGAHRGRVFAGDFGPTFRRTYSVKGDAVNLAARVMAQAGPGQVLVTADLVSNARTTFQVTPLEPFLVKGKRRPVHAVALGAATGSKGQGLSVELLVGRDRELAEIEDALGRAKGGSGGFVDIVGEAGIGKSRLVEEVMARAADLRVLRVTCEQYASGVPYGPVRTLLLECLGLETDRRTSTVADVLRATVAAKAPSLQTWLPLLGIPLDLNLPDTATTAELDEQFRQGRLEQVTIELLEVLLEGPTLIVIDEAHLADDASADLFQRLGETNSDRPWLLVAARRGSTGFVPEGSAVLHMPLGALHPSATVALAEVVTENAPLPPQVLQALARRAGGNPLFLRELVRTASRGDTMGELPETVEALVTSQLDELPPSERTLLRYAAVLGVAFDEQLLRDMVALRPLPAGHVSVDRLTGFLDRDATRLRFRHALLRDVAYEGLAYRRRRDLHRVVGQLLEGSTTEPEALAELLSLHFFEAGAMREAWHYSRVAAARARSKYAHTEAAEHLQRAIAASSAVPDIATGELADVLESLGNVRFLVGASHDAAAAYRAARRHVRGQPVREARLMLMEARVQQRLARYSQALRWLSRGLSVLDDAQGAVAHRSRALLSARYAVCRISQGRYGAAQRWGHLAADEARLADDRDALAQALLALHMADLWRGRQAGTAYGEQAHTLYQELGDLAGQAHSLNNLAITALFEGRWTDALAMFRGAAESFHRIGDAGAEANAVYNEADVLVRQGRSADAEVLLVDALRVARAVDDEELVALVIRERGRAASRASRHDEALDLLADARTRFVELGEPHEVVDTDVAVAESWLMRGDAAQAAVLAAQCLDQAQTVHAATLLPVIHRIRGLSLLQLGRVDEAQHHLELGLQLSSSPDVRHERGFVLAGLALTARRRGEADRATALAEESQEVLAALGVVTAPMPPSGVVPLQQGAG